MTNLQIIAIDDQSVNLKVIKGLASKVNLKTIDYTNPVEAIDYISNNPIDMILVDYMMPQMNGIEVIRHTRAIHPDIPIVMITAINENKNIQLEAIQAGATEFLYKPLDPLEFQARIQNLAQLRESQLLLKDQALLLQSEVDKATVTIQDRELEALKLLARTAEYRDEETGEHIMRVANYSRIIAEENGQDEQFQCLIFNASPLHDIGKVGTPDAILNKPGKLTDKEMQTMRKHPFIGYNMLKVAVSPYIRMGAEIAMSHHEKYDGSGYPKRLKGDEIPLSGRIVSIADVFDALTSKRPYKDPWPIDKTIDLLIDEKGQHFDPALVDAFIRRKADVLEIFEKYSEKE